MMKQIIFVSKKGTLSTDDVIKIFMSTDDLKVIKNAVEKAEDRVYTSWASVDVVDKDNERIPINDLIKEQETLIERGGAITDNHSNRVVGKTLAYKVLEHPDSGTTGVMHLNKIFSNNAVDDQVWKETQSGERTGSSVGGINEGEHAEFDRSTGKQATVLENFAQFETANVFNPANPLALNHAVSVVAKGNVERDDVIGKKKSFAGFDNLTDCVLANLHTEEDPIGYCMTMQKSFDESHKGCSKPKKKEIVINKNPKIETMKSHEVELMEVDELKKMFEESVSPIAKSVEDLKKEVQVLKEEMPEKVSPKDPDNDPNTSKPEKKKAEKQDMPEEEDEDKKKVKKEIDLTADQESEPPKDPTTDDANAEEGNVYKKEDIQKMIQEALKKEQESNPVSKGKTPRPGIENTTPVSKEAKEYRELPLKLAKGEVRKSFSELNKLHSKIAGERY